MTAAGSAGEAVTPPLKLAFENWLGSQGYDEDGMFDADEMEFAFEAGAEAERDLAHAAIAAQQPPAAPDSRRALLDIIDTVDHLDEPGPEADHIRLLAEYGLGEGAHPEPHVCEPMTVQPSDDVKPAPGVILDRLRAAVANHEAPLHRQWYVDEHIIDCDPAEFWAVLAVALQQPQPAPELAAAKLSDALDDFHFERKQVVALRQVLTEMFTCLNTADMSLLDADQVDEWRERAGIEAS